MVEAQPAAAAETREQIRARIKERFTNVFNTLDSYEVKIEEEDGNLQIRQTWDEENNTMINFGECKNAGDLVPEDFKQFMTEWEIHGLAANKTFVALEKVATDNGVDTMKIQAHAPWPLQNRVFFTTLYLELDQEDGSQLMTFCDDGNDSIRADENAFTAKERKDLTLAHIYLSGFWAQPVKDESGAVVSSRILYCNMMEVGGNVPTFVQSSKGPKTALNAVKGAIAWANENKQR